MPVNVGWLNEKPQYWSTYLPNKDDYATGEEYLNAISDGSKAYYEDSTPIGEYWDPIGQVTRGGAQTEVEQGLRKLQHKFNKIGTDPLNNMGLQNWITLHPELAMAAYGAYTPTGEPVLDPAMLALIERLLGVEAKPAPVPTEPKEPRVINVPPGALPDPNHPNGPGQHPDDVVPPSTPPSTPPRDDAVKNNPIGQGVSRTDTVANNPIGQGMPAPGTENYMAASAGGAGVSDSVRDLLKQMGISPPGTAQGQSFSSDYNQNAVNQTGIAPQQSSLYPPQMLQRLHDLRKNVLYGNKPMPPKIGY